jgi:hypothetical protein
MAKRSVRPPNPPRDDVDTAEPAQPKAKRSRTADRDPVETANDSTGDSSPQAAAPSEIEIRERAYHRYVQRGGGHGMDFDDWLEAERELKKSEV